MNKTPAPETKSPACAGGAEKNTHAAAVSNDAGKAGILYRRESMGTAQGEGRPSPPPTCAQIVSELTCAKVVFQQRTICAAIAAPFIIENGKVSPLVPVAIIDRESYAGSYADALAHSVNITVSDFNHSNDLPQEGK